MAHQSRPVNTPLGHTMQNQPGLANLIQKEPVEAHITTAITDRGPRKSATAPVVISLFLLVILYGCGGGSSSETPEPTFTTPPDDTPVVLIARPTSTAQEAAATASEEAGAPANQVLINITDKHTISPFIYGVADPTSVDEDTLKWLGTTLARWGGNARSRHNWEINASNSGADNQFRNVAQGDTTPGSASLNFLLRNDRIGAASILTIPTLGWVAKDGDNNTQSLGVPDHGGPATEKGSDSALTLFKDEVWSKPYDPSANRIRTSLHSFPAKGAPYSYPPDLADGKVYQDEWVAYLRNNRPHEGLAPIYAMDNEPDLWADSTHVDVSPVRQSYDTMLSTFITYSRAIKQADPTGLIAGPESWGVTGYLFSALDEGGDKFATAADRKAHNNAPFLQWFLRSVNTADKLANQRSLDILTVHYYPTAGQYGGGNDPAMQDKRVQAPRALWDGLYVEPSWVASTEWANLGLLRRLKTLVSQYYAGTRIGLTEWNFGGEDDISGAVATADALGIFGREDLYCASYWGLPKQGSATGWAFRLYRNYDGNGAAFGEQSVATKIEDTRTMSAYGALTQDGKKLTVVLINKGRTASKDVSIKAVGFAPRSEGEVYRYSQSGHTAIIREPLKVSNPAAVSVTLPPMSINMVVLSK